MKKVFSLLLLLTFGAFAQDNATINAMVQSNTVEEIKATSDKISSLTADKFSFYKVTDRTLREDKFKVVVYTPASMTEEEKQEFSPEEKAKCLLVIWKATESGYTFYDVTSTEQNLKPFWNQTFTTTDTQYRVNKDLKYKIVKNEETYSILKSY